MDHIIDVNDATSTTQLEEIQICCSSKLLQISIRYINGISNHITSISWIAKIAKPKFWRIKQNLSSQKNMYYVHPTPANRNDKMSRKKPRIIVYEKIHSQLPILRAWDWLLIGSQLSTSFCKQMTGSSMLKTGRQQVDHLVYHLICLCRSVFAKAASFKTQNPCNHFNWKSIDVNWYLVNKQFIITVHRPIVGSHKVMQMNL